MYILLSYYHNINVYWLLDEITVSDHELAWWCLVNMIFFLVCKWVCKNDMKPSVFF